jgi:hypothetical protein
MNPRRKAIGTTPLALGAVALVVVAATSILLITRQSGTNSTTNTPINGTRSTACEVPVEGSGVFLHVVSDSNNQSLSGIFVQVVPRATSCYGVVKPSPADYTTNATGWISINVSNTQANWYFETSTVYAGRTYSFNLPQGPLDTTNATLSLPSGNLGISLCYTMATSNPCRPYSTTTTNASQSTITITSVQGGIVVVSARLVGPYTPAGPTVELTLQNQQGCCLMSLSATLVLNNNYTFYFKDVNSSHPLDQGQVVTATQTLIGAGFDSNQSYPLVIKGTTQDTIFTDTIRMQITSS